MAEAASERRTLERLIQAHAEAVAKFYSDKSSAVKAYLAYDKESSAADLARVYDLMAARNVFERIPYVPKAAVAAALDQEGGEPRNKLSDFRAAVDNSILN